MNSRRRSLALALIALVAVTAVLVYGQREWVATKLAAQEGNGKSANENGPLKEIGEGEQPSAAVEEAEPKKTAPKASESASAAEIFYDPEGLPEPVRQMREEIIEAARSGELEALRRCWNRTN